MQSHIRGKGNDYTAKDTIIRTFSSFARITSLLIAEKLEQRDRLHIMCFDAEGVDGDTSEYGFAWYRASDTISIIPDTKGQNWFPKLQAKRFLVNMYKNHPGSKWIDGDPKGFWQDYGKTVIYDPKQGSTPFNELFKSITGNE